MPVSCRLFFTDLVGDGVVLFGFDLWAVLMGSNYV